jgi:hypothetical protein
MKSQNDQESTEDEELRDRGKVSLLTSEIIHDIDNCRNVWEEFSPKQSLFDTWEFRYAFYLGYKHTPHFILLKHRDAHLGLLPLWYEENKQKYFWFGSYWQEDNKFLVKDPSYIPTLLELAPTPYVLNAIEWASVMDLKNQGAASTPDLDEPKYIVDLSRMTSINDFLARFKSKKRYNINYDRKRIEALNPKIIIDRFSDFDSLVNICKVRFASKNELTDWEDAARIDTFRHVLRLGQNNISYSVKMLSVVIGGEVASVDLIAIFNKCYYPLKCAYNTERFPGIGNYVNIIEIEDAINMGMKKIDFLEEEYGWKDKWFQTIPLYKLESA